MLIHAADSVLVVVDIQQKLVPAMHEPARTLSNTKLLLEAAQACHVPTLLTEQYPKGLGRTVPEIKDAANASPIFEKMHFSCMEDSYFFDAFCSLERKQAILVGMEAHVCVLQTAASMIEAGFDVFVTCDAITSRSADSIAACITRLNASRGSIVTAEMVVFEWLGKAGTPAFNQLLPSIK